MFTVIYEGDSGLEAFGPFDDFSSAKKFMHDDSTHQIEYLKQNSQYPIDIEETEISIKLNLDNENSVYNWTIAKLKRLK